MKRSVTAKRKAAVLILIRGADSPHPQVLLTKRAAHLSSHAGEIAFPGGMADEQDDDLQATALRETHEEVGVAADFVVVKRQLPRSFTRQGVEVVPFVAHLIGEPLLRLSADEIDSAFWLPLSFVSRDPRVRTDIFRRDEQEFWAPVYQFETHVIWGFTARLLVDFMNVCGGGEVIDRAHAAPESIFM